MCDLLSRNQDFGYFPAHWQKKKKVNVNMLDHSKYNMTMSCLSTDKATLYQFPAKEPKSKTHGARKVLFYTRL